MKIDQEQGQGKWKEEEEAGKEAILTVDSHRGLSILWAQKCSPCSHPEFLKTLIS